MGGFTYAAWKQKTIGAKIGGLDPVSDRLPRFLGDFELHRALGLLLHDRGATRDSQAVGNVPDTQLDQVACAQLAVNRQVEERQVAGAARQLQAHPDSPYFLQLERGLLANELSLMKPLRSKVGRQTTPASSLRIVPRLAMVCRRCEFHGDLQKVVG